MKEGMELLEEFNKILEKEIQKVVDHGEIKAEWYDNLSKAVCMMKDTKKAEQIMMEMDDCSGEYGFSRGHSMTRGRSPITGRYVSRTEATHHMAHPIHGYSMHSYKDRILADLENRALEAPTENDRMFVEGLINYIEG